MPRHYYDGRVFVGPKLYRTTRRSPPLRRLTSYTKTCEDHQTRIRYACRAGTLDFEPSCGSSDHTSLWSRGGTLYFLSVNRGLGYFGVDRLDYDPATRTWSLATGIFEQSDHGTAVLGRRGVDLEDIEIVRRSLPYL